MVSEWRRDKLGNYLKLKGGYAFKSTDFKESGDVPVLRISNIKSNGTISLEDAVYVESKIAEENHSYLLRSGNIVIAMSGATTGKTAVVKEVNTPCLLNQRVGLFQIHDHDKLCEEFLRYVVQSDSFKNSIGINAIGGAQPNIRGKQIEEIECAIPPLKEQLKIADILTSVDSAIEKTEAIIEQTEKVKKGLMQLLLTKGIGHTKFKKMEIGEVPEEWEVHTFDSLFDFYSGMPLARSALGTEGALYLHYGDIHKQNRRCIDTRRDADWLPKVLLRNEQIKTQSLLSTGDIVFTDASEDMEGVGKYVVIKNEENKTFISGLHTIIAKEKKSYFDNTYKEYCFQSPLIKRQLTRIATGATVLGISKSNMKKLLIAVPTINEQIRIGTLLKSLDERKDLEIKKLETLTKIKKGLMQGLLTGKVRVKVDETEAVNA